MFLCRLYSEMNEEKMPVKQITNWTIFWRNSNSDYDDNRTFNAFPLNLTSIRKSP